MRTELTTARGFYERDPRLDARRAAAEAQRSLDVEHEAARQRPDEADIWDWPTRNDQEEPEGVVAERQTVPG